MTYAVNDAGILDAPDGDSLYVRLVQRLPEQRNERGRRVRRALPAQVNVGGHMRHFTDPDHLRVEAERLLAAAYLLEEQQAADRIADWSS